MKAVNIILIILLVFFVILHLYYLFYVRRIALEKELQYEKFYAFQNEYTDELYDTDNTFRLCELGSNSQCTTTYAALENNNAEFMNTRSKYHVNYSLPIIQANDYNIYNDVMTLKSFLAYRCIQSNPRDFKTRIEQATFQGGPMATVYKKMMLFDEDDLNRYIASLLNEFKSKIDANSNKATSKILTPVYLCISQAPYLNYQGQMIKSRFDVTHNKRGFYKETKTGNTREFVLESGNEASSEISSLYTEILLIFPYYKTVSSNTGPNGAAVENYAFVADESRLATFLNTIVASITSSDQLCFLRCNKSPMTCGCLNATPNDMKMEQQNPPYTKAGINMQSIKEYTSTCYNHEDIITNYSLLYYLNPYSTEFNSILLNTNKSLEMT
jgi:hypothetical protein